MCCSIFRAQMCFVDHCLSLCAFSFGYCIVCPFRFTASECPLNLKSIIFVNIDEVKVNWSYRHMSSFGNTHDFDNITWWYSANNLPEWRCINNHDATSNKHSYPPLYRREFTRVFPPLYRREFTRVFPPLYRREFTRVFPPLYRREFTRVFPPLHSSKRGNTRVNSLLCKGGNIRVNYLLYKGGNTRVNSLLCKGGNTRVNSLLYKGGNTRVNSLSNCS
jgi:hypothetical protein